MEVLDRPRYAGFFIRPRHEVERVAFPRPCFRPRAPIVGCLDRKLHAIKYGPKLHERGLPHLANKSQLPLHPPVGLRTVDGSALAADAGIGYQPSELVLSEFGGVFRVKACRLPGGVDCRQENAETVCNNARALVRQNDQPVHFGVVDDRQPALNAAR